MAGRGTDIVLDPEVKELGGLVVIGSERHESRRIDNQLRGRSGRQGDPGESQFYVSTEDDLMRIFQGERITNLMSRLGVDDEMAIQNKAITKTLENAQKRVEGYHYDSRKNVVQYDNVINRHRKVVYSMRKKILKGEDIRKEILGLIKTEVNELAALPAKNNPEFVDDYIRVFGAEKDEAIKIGAIKKDKQRLNGAFKEALRLYEEQEENLGSDVMRKVEREIYMQVLDNYQDRKSVV